MQAERGELERFALAPVAQRDPRLRARERDELLAEEERVHARVAHARRTWRANANAGDATPARKSAVAAAFSSTSARIQSGSQVWPPRNAWKRRQVASSRGRRAASAAATNRSKPFSPPRRRPLEPEVAVVRGGRIAAMERDPAREEEQRQREQQAERGLRRAGHAREIGRTAPQPYAGPLTRGPRRVDSSGVDVMTRFREYVRLDRQRREGGLSLQELHRFQALKRFLSIHFAPDRPEVADTRDSVRVPTRIKVSFAADRELAHCLMTNLSRGGVFVQTDHPLELKTTFTLVIHVESPPREIAVPVEVVSVGIGPEFARDKRGHGPALPRDAGGDREAAARAVRRRDEMMARSSARTW